jgi:diacylglycerol kinase family enzyme
VPALERDGRFDVHKVDPRRLQDELRAAVDAGAARVLVAGGDGTVRTAATVLAGTPVELAIIPAGTLNHFARHLGVPADPGEAAEIATGGVVRTVDVGYVNGQLILNTSSVGAYVTFVRARERLERRLGYRMASLLAFGRILLHLSTFRVALEIDGKRLVYSTPLAFVGIGERELTLPAMDRWVPEGRRGLHVLVVHGRGRTQLVLRGMAIAARGLPTLPRRSRTGIDSFVVDRCRIEMRRPRGNVGVDGEILPMTAPLDFHLVRDAVRVVSRES